MNKKILFAAMITTATLGVCASADEDVTLSWDYSKYVEVGFIGVDMNLSHIELTVSDGNSYFMLANPGYEYSTTVTDNLDFMSEMDDEVYVFKNGKAVKDLDELYGLPENGDYTLYKLENPADYNITFTTTEAYEIDIMKKAFDVQAEADQDFILFCTITDGNGKIRKEAMRIMTAATGYKTSVEYYRMGAQDPKLSIDGIYLLSGKGDEIALRETDAVSLNNVGDKIMQAGSLFFADAVNSDGKVNKDAMVTGLVYTQTTFEGLDYPLVSVNSFFNCIGLIGVDTEYPADMFDSLDLSDSLESTEISSMLIAPDAIVTLDSDLTRYEDLPDYIPSDEVVTENGTVSEEDNVITEETPSSVDLNSPELIKAVQQKLNDNGFDCGTPDGVAGSKTYSAIADYQSQNGLAVTSQIDEELIEHMGL